ncbi:gp179 [Sphingomonas phage PAU]|uniref:gp179 n=1 Tax=Sphingomonas phage PAU TaxID=1150991 RepID=UPI00025732FF|nr:gp179 [Sphingomonas phage PAU]AFF28177.1 gp179 [Sphingomonas phage PAU]
MRKLYILKFDESLDDVSWYSKDSDHLTVSEVKNFVEFAKDGFEINLISYISETRKRDNLTFLNVFDFIDTDIKESDVVIFWTGYNYSTRVKCGVYGTLWYTCFASLHNKPVTPYVLCTDTRCFMMNPEFFMDNKVYSSVIGNTIDSLAKSVDKVKFKYLTQARNTEEFKNLVRANRDANQNFLETIHIPTHLLPLVSHRMENITYEHDNQYVYYGSAPIDFSKKRDYRTENIFNLFYANNFTNKAKGRLIINTKACEVPTQITSNIKVSDRIPYSEIKNMLNKSFASVILSEEAYQKCELIPNRLIEGLAAKTLLLIHEQVLGGLMKTIHDIGFSLLQVIDISNERDYETSKQIDELASNHELRRSIIISNQKLLKTIFNPLNLTNTINRL